MEIHKTFDSCGGCLSDTALILATPEIHSIYQFLVKEEVKDLKICSVCTHDLEGIQKLQAKCRASLDSLKLKIKMKCKNPEPVCNKSLEKANIILKDDKYKCPDCDKTFRNRTNVRRHYRLSHQTILKCSKCPSEFHSEIQLKRHAKKHENKVPKCRVTCDRCGISIACKQELKRHWRRIHSPKDVACPYPKCMKKFTCERYVKRHVLRNHPSLKHDEDLEKHLNRFKPKEGITCDRCGKKIAKKEAFILHWKQVHDSKELFCPFDDCKKIFNSRKHVEKHVDLYHGKKFCKFCNEPYEHFTDEEFRQHLAAGHSFVCDICAFTTDQKVVFKGHMRKLHISPNEKHECYKCKIVFDDKEKLKSHNESVHMEATFACSQCDQKFVREGYLSNHVYQVHRYKKCPHCGKDYLGTFIGSHIRRVHERMRRWKCAICNLTFFDKSSAIRHLYTHGNEKPFNCHLCSAGFVDERSVHKHYNSVHSIFESNKDILKMIVRGKPGVADADSCLVYIGEGSLRGKIKTAKKQRDN